MGVVWFHNSPKWSKTRLPLPPGPATLPTLTWTVGLSPHGPERAVVPDSTCHPTNIQPGGLLRPFSYPVVQQMLAAHLLQNLLRGPA